MHPNHPHAPERETARPYSTTAFRIHIVRNNRSAFLGGLLDAQSILAKDAEAHASALGNVKRESLVLRFSLSI